MLEDGISRLRNAVVEGAFRLLVRLESLMTDYGRNLLRTNTCGFVRRNRKVFGKTQLVRVPVRVRVERNYRRDDY